MGFYIETDGNFFKAPYLIKHHGAKLVFKDEIIRLNLVESHGVVVVIDNGIFEAAGFAYDLREFNSLAEPDGRPKVFLVMDRKKAEELSGFRKVERREGVYQTAEADMS